MKRRRPTSIREVTNFMDPDVMPIAVGRHRIPHKPFRYVDLPLLRTGFVVNEPRRDLDVLLALDGMVEAEVQRETWPEARDLLHAAHSKSRKAAKRFVSDATIPHRVCWWVMTSFADSSGCPAGGWR